MDKLEKVIKGIECCRRGFCFSCPYNDGVDENTECKQKWADDALSLLKAQEPIEPIKHLSTGQICGSCKKVLLRKYKYCPECGKAVNWNG